MRMLTKCCFLLSVIVVLPIASRAQNLSPDLNDAGVKLDHAFDEYMHGWKRERVTPVYPKENVWIEVWIRCDRTVKISILTHSSDTAASKSLEEFARYDSSRKKLDGVGDEALTWGYGSDVAFRRGHLNVFVSAQVDQMALSVEESQRAEFQRAEMAATNKMIAGFVDKMLQCPTVRCVVGRY